MSYDLHDYVSVIQFLAAACFSLSFEKVLDLSLLGHAVSKYNTELFSLYNQYLFGQQEKIDRYENIVKKYGPIEKLPISSDDNKFIIPSCLGPYSGWFFFFAILAFIVLCVSKGASKFPCRHEIWLFWLGMFLASLGILFWVVLTGFKYLSFSLNSVHIKETNKNIRLSYGKVVSPENDKYDDELLNALPTKTKNDLLAKRLDDKGLREKVNSYQLQKLDDFLGKWLICRLWSHITRNKKYILPK